MPQALLISVDEYLRTSYRPDCDFIDGEVQERFLGERDHSTLQLALGVVFHRNRDAWKVVPLPEQRVQVTDTRFRVPDLCIVRTGDPHDQIVRVAPLLCIEILSPEDTLSRLQTRVDDYVALGVEHIWVIDPSTRRIYTAGPLGFIEVRSGALEVPGTPIRVSFAELFADLDEDQGLSR